jgi:hypothetical protein
MKFARASVWLPFWKHFKSLFPACNVHRWNKNAVMDTFFCNPPDHDGDILGHADATMAQLYVGKTSSKTVVYSMCLESDMPSTLEDLICQHGALNSLFSDNTKIQCGKLPKQAQSSASKLCGTQDWGYQVPHQCDHGPYRDQCSFLAPLPPPSGLPT